MGRTHTALLLPLVTSLISMGLVSASGMFRPPQGFFLPPGGGGMRSMAPLDSPMAGPPGGQSGFQGGFGFPAHAGFQNTPFGYGPEQTGEVSPQIPMQVYIKTRAHTGKHMCKSA